MAFRRQRLPDDLTPEEREARIADLRARRKRRMRVLAIRSAIAGTVLGALLLVGVYWALTTLGGRDFLLAQIVARLPAGTTLDWRDAEGPAAGPLTLRDVRFTMLTCPDVDERPVPFGECATPRKLMFSAARVTIDPDIRPLVGRRLRLDVLEVERATLELPPSVDEPFELPRWPDVLPQIALPLALQADTIVVDGLRVLQADAPVIDIRSVRGGLDARDGRIDVANLVVDSDRGLFRAHGHYAPADDYDADLTVSALLPAPLGRPRPRAGLVVRGDIASLDIAATAHAPEPARLRLSLRGGGAPDWTFTARATALDPSLLAGTGTPGTPLALELDASGKGGRAQLQGRFAQGTFEARVQPSTLALEHQVLAFEPLVVDVFDGRITARGKGDFGEGDPLRAPLKFAVNARGITLAGTPGDDGVAPPSIVVDADLGIAGTQADWAAIGKATVARDGQQADVELDGRGDADGMRFETLRATMPSGKLDATGTLAWAPSLAWALDATLAGFDPGYFAPDWPGRIDGTLATEGRTRDDGGLDVDVDAPSLKGRLRGRALDARGDFAMQGGADATQRDRYEGELALTLGGSKVDARGTYADTIDASASFAPLDLADLLPGAAGRFEGGAKLTGRADAPVIDADLRGSGVRYADYAAATVALQGRLPWRGRDGTLTLDATGVQAGLALDTVRVTAEGAVEDLRASGEARGEMGAVDITASARRSGNGWQGELAALRLAPQVGAAWRLQAPTRFAQAPGRFTLSRGCFASESGGELCAEADWPRGGVTARADALPLALVAPYLPARDDGRRWILRGDIALDAQLRPAGSGFAGHVRIDSAGGGLRFRERARRDVVGYRDLDFDADLSASAIRATLSTRVNGDDRIDAALQTGWTPTSALSGEVNVDMRQLTWMELFSADIVEPTGQLAGHVTLGGTRAAPSIGGQAALTGFGTELPSLGIVVSDGNLRMDALPDGSARLDGSLSTGEGRLEIDGSLGWRGGAPIALNISGENVLVSDTRDLRATASPDLQVTIAAAQPLSVRGSVTVPSALIDLERLDDGVGASPDVVVLDPVDPDRDAPSSIDLDLTLAMGKDVKLRGFGLDGTLGGEMRVRAVPGREMTAQGALQVGGKYAAYGQELQISRGELQWSNGPVSDPILDIRAERRIEAQAITAGIDVTGRASAPQASVWTDPASGENEALSYLALGRSTANLSSEEGRQLDAASAALSTGGSLLASQIGSRIGLDDAGVIESRALGGSVLGIGKQLSPKLYVGFGVSLLGTGQVLTLKYLLRKGFDLEIESSTLESRGSVNWRHEK